MSENTKIEWCDHTFNPWIGCIAAGFIQPVRPKVFCASLADVFDNGVDSVWRQEVNERDFRTIRFQYPSVTYDPKEKGDDAHEALADAVFQAKHLFAIKNRNKINV